MDLEVADKTAGHRLAMTASVIDSKDFIAAKRRADRMPLMPAGNGIAFACGLDVAANPAVGNIVLLCSAVNAVDMSALESRVQPPA